MKLITWVPQNVVYMCWFIFQQFGETEYVRILRDRVSKESKGLAYVKYFRAYHAALAYEGCNQRELTGHVHVALA